MTRAQVIRRLGALRRHVDLELGEMLADLERPAGKSAEPQNTDIDGQHARRVDQLLRSGVGADAVVEAELVAERTC